MYSSGGAGGRADSSWQRKCPLATGGTLPPPAPALGPAGRRARPGPARWSSGLTHRPAGCALRPPPPGIARHGLPSASQHLPAGPAAPRPPEQSRGGEGAVGNTCPSPGVRPWRGGWSGRGCRQAGARPGIACRRPGWAPVTGLPLAAGPAGGWARPWPGWARARPPYQGRRGSRQACEGQAATRAQLIPALGSSKWRRGVRVAAAKEWAGSGVSVKNVAPALSPAATCL